MAERWRYASVATAKVLTFLRWLLPTDRAYVRFVRYIDVTRFGGDTLCRILASSTSTVDRDSPLPLRVDSLLLSTSMPVATMSYSASTSSTNGQQYSSPLPPPAREFLVNVDMWTTFANIKPGKNKVSCNGYFILEC